MMVKNNGSNKNNGGDLLSFYYLFSSVLGVFLILIYISGLGEYYIDFIDE